ncbi:MAG: succinate--CoA ligase subunit alpha [Candidatus Methanomethylicia archaeon]
MAILANKNTYIVVQGITGREGAFHTKLMLEYGSKIIAGVSPGKSGQQIHGVPVYDSIEEALKNHSEINTSIIFVPARYASDAVYEAIDGGLKLIVVITEGIPVHETLKFVNYAKSRGVHIVGPNCPGIITPGQCKIGILPVKAFKPGRVGIVSRSGTLTYEIAEALTRRGVGQSTVLGIGGDPITGLNFIEVVDMFEADKDTDIIVVIGEIGGDMEERLAKHIVDRQIRKPIVAYIAGRTAPPGKRMGHAGAIISMGTGSAESKIKALREAGVKVAETPKQVAELVAEYI